MKLVPLDEEMPAGANFLFAETSTQQEARLKAASKFGNLQTWKLLRIIVKSGDDLRQEQFAMQMISFMQQIFQTSGKETKKLWLRSYEIMASGPGCGLIEFLPDSLSIDYIKRKL